MNLIEQFKEYLKKQGLSDEQVEKVIKDMPGSKFYLVNEEKLDERYAKLKGQKEHADELYQKSQEAMRDLEKKLDKDSEASKDIEAYKTQIKTLQEKYDRDVTLVTKRQLAVEELRKEGAKHPDLLVASMDLDKITLQDGKISGHADMIKAFKESYADQFEVKNEGGNKEGAESDSSKEGNGYSYSPASGKGAEGQALDIFSAMNEFAIRK